MEERGAELIVGRCAVFPEEAALPAGSFGLAVVGLPGRDALPVAADREFCACVVWPVRLAPGSEPKRRQPSFPEVALAPRLLFAAPSWFVPDGEDILALGPAADAPLAVRFVPEAIGSLDVFMAVVRVLFWPEAKRPSCWIAWCTCAAWCSKDCGAAAGRLPKKCPACLPRVVDGLAARPLADKLARVGVTGKFPVMA